MDTTSAASLGTGAERFAALQAAREPFLIRAREAAQLTKPYLMPPNGFNASMFLPTPYQSLGARGVRNLASKLLLALYPSQPFFRYEMSDFLLEKMGAARGDFEKAMARRERAIMDEVDKACFRNDAYTSFEHLIVTGNYLIHVPTKSTRTRGFRLDQYVVSRAPDGTLLELVVEERIDIQTLPQAARDAMALAEATCATPDAEYPGAANPNDAATGHKTASLFTHVYLGDDGLYHTYQECRNTQIPGSQGSYPADQLPWLPLRFSCQPGEDYGRGYVEELLGDLDSLEALCQTLVEGIAAAARIVFLVKPNGVTRVKVIATARNGDVKTGNAEDVTVVETQKKSADFQTAQKQAEVLATNLSYAFMLNSAIQRNGDRVTAEEIRYMAGELDDSLGGVYTLFSTEYQLPIVLLFEGRMMKAQTAPPLPKNTATPTITSGLQALGRGTDLANMKAFLADVIQVLTPPVATQYLNLSEFLSRAAAAYNIDDDGLILSQQEVQANQQQAAQAQMVNQLGPHAIKAAGGIAQAAISNQQQGQQPDNASQ